ADAPDETGGGQVGEIEQANDQDVLPGVPFVGVVPNFIQADWFRATPRSQGENKAGRKRIIGGLHWAIHLAVINQRSSEVVLPDVLLGQALWGGNRQRWPKNWRAYLLAQLRLFAGGAQSPLIDVQDLEKDAHQKGCP